MLRIMLEKRDLRIFSTIILVILFVIATLYLYPIIIGFAAFILYYWYLSGSISLGLFLFYHFFNNYRKNNQKAMLYDSFDNRDDFELETGFKSIENNTLSKMYRKWLLRKNRALFSIKFKAFYEKLGILAGILLLFVIFALALTWLSLKLPTINHNTPNKRVRSSSRT